MVYRVVFKPIALIDADEAATWYNKKVAGLGGRFLIHLDDIIKKIEANPFAFGEIAAPVRRIVMRSFLTKSFILFQEQTSLYWLLFTTGEAKGLLKEDLKTGDLLKWFNQKIRGCSIKIP
jgi:hypothetical protein